MPSRCTVISGAVAIVLTAVTAAAAAATAPRDGGRARGGQAAAGVISTVAGGVGGPGRATGVVVVPCGVAFSAGFVYAGAGAVVRKVSLRTGRLTTPAGTGTGAPLGDGGPAARAALQGACGVAVDHSGNLVIADEGGEEGTNARVRVVAARTGTFYGQAMTGGDIYTVAGEGTAGFSGDGGPATKAALGNPSGVAVDGAGNLVIADFTNDRIRAVAASTGTFYGQVMKAGDIYTVAGDGTRGFSGDGGPATKAELHSPSAVAVDGAGNLVLAETLGQRVRVVAARTGTFYAQAMTAGDIYTVAGDGIRGFSGDGGPATAAEIGFPQGVAVDGAGNLVIGAAGNSRVRVVAASTGTFYGQVMTVGDIYTVAGDGTQGFSGDGGPATKAGFDSPEGVAVDGAGNLVIADAGNSRVRVVAASTGSFYGLAMTGGDIYTVAGNGILGFSGDGGPATRAELGGPGGVAVDGAGNLVIPGNNRVRVVAARTGRFYRRAMTGGDIYTVAGDGTSGFSGDGGPATRAELGGPGRLAVDRAGNLVLTDTGNNRIRVVAVRTGRFYRRAMKAGDIYTVAGDGAFGFFGDGGPATKARLRFPSAVALDGAGNLVFTDTKNNRIRVIAARTGTFYRRAMKAGDIYTVAGDGAFGFFGDGRPATRAELGSPSDVAVDGAGNLVIADTNNNRVQVVAASTGRFYGRAMKAGDIYTVAGNGDGTGGFSGDGGPAIKAELAVPYGVTVDGAGNLVIADSFNNRIRVVAARTGRFYRRAMKAGDIYTLAGDGARGFSGDGGPATQAELAFPTGAIADRAGNLVIADPGNDRIRAVAG